MQSADRPQYMDIPRSGPASRREPVLADDLLQDRNSPATAGPACLCLRYASLL
jgi:hypothetical protein